VIWNAPRHQVAAWHGIGFGSHMEANMAAGGRSIAKWLALGLVAAGAVTGYVLAGVAPEYASQATLRVEPQRVAEDVMRVSPPPRLEDRLLYLQTSIFSRTRLERLIQDFGLYKAERQAGVIMQDLCERMRRKIDVHVDRTQSADSARSFVVSFADKDRRKAQQVAETLAGALIQESDKISERMAENTAAFVESQIDRTGQRLTEVNDRLARTKTGAEAARVQIEAEVVRESYRALLAKREESAMRIALVVHRVGDRLTLIDPARLPERPLGPTRRAGAIAGALAGLSLVCVVGLFIFVWRVLAARTPTAVAAL